MEASYTTKSFDETLYSDILGNKQESGVLDYISLLKPNVMVLVVFSAIVGMILAPGKISAIDAIISVLAITIGSGSAGAINMWYEYDLDALMSRTKSRPIPSGRIERDDALFFGCALAIVSVIILAFYANYLAACLLAYAIAHYVLIYTVCLKRTTHHNVLIGGVAGALPPVIGWVAITGEISLMPIILFTLIFFWTLPHSWAIMIYKINDYTNAKIPVLPVVKGINVTKKHVCFYTAITILVSLLPMAVYNTGMIFNSITIFANIGFIYYTYAMYNSSSDTIRTTSIKLFSYSLIYLFVVLAALPIDQYF